MVGAEDIVITRDKRLSSLIVAIFLVESIYRILMIACDYPPIIKAGYICILIGITLSTLQLLADIDLRLYVVVECLLGVACFGSCLAGIAASSDLIDTFATASLVCVPALCALASMSDKKVLLVLLRRVAPFWAIALTGALMLLHNQKSYSDGSAMVLSYCLLVPILVILQQIFTEFKVVKMVILLGAILAMFLFGSRSPLIAIAMLLVFEVVSYGIAHRRQAVVPIVLGALFCVLVLLSIEYLLGFILNLLNDMGIYYSRNAYYLLQGEALDLNKRDEIWEQYAPYILQKPIFGWGLGSVETLVGISPHNSLLEVIASFGICGLGLYAIGAIGGYIACLRTLSCDDAESNLLRVFASYSVPFFLVRGYTFTTIGLYFFFALAFIVIASRVSRKRNKIAI